MHVYLFTLYQPVRFALSFSATAITFCQVSSSKSVLQNRPKTSLQKDGGEGNASVLFSVFVQSALATLSLTMPASMCPAISPPPLGFVGIPPSNRQRGESRAAAVDRWLGRNKASHDT